ncbi:MAG: hypothetical protein KKA65_03655 [Nanoarchaeota archaeon]|nr:hypothetical protein [Nanoarchaeota archaeon]MBU4352325.1 hypothetical protein [Nanoarchaeota archaeon]MBU4456573.1 hypothetical protein [Nanoarchaeota archaeon]MCG2719670.1 hypothetical protein [Nanoarchaeota archaeon]
MRKIFLVLIIFGILLLVSGCDNYLFGRGCKGPGCGVGQEVPISDILKMPEDCVSYYDGCNTCSEFRGELRCTNWDCEFIEEAKCLVSKIKPEFNPPEDCIKYNDGCNVCDLINGSWLCADKSCERFTEPKCWKYGDPPLFNPSKNCLSYDDGCNICHLKKGNWECYEEICKTYREPSCIRMKVTIPSKCKKYFDGCNVCDIFNGELRICTQKGCGEYEEPKCLEYRWI